MNFNNKKRHIQNKALSSIIFEVNGYVLSSVVQTIIESTSKTENTYIVSYFKYRNKRISLNKKRKNVQKRGNFSKDKEKLKTENLIRNEIIKNNNITVKEISSFTDLSEYTVNRYYMRIRREQFPRCLK